MGDVLNFKCPSCGAALPFNGATGEMTCEYCGAGFTMEQVRAAEEAEKENAAASDMTWTTSGQLMITDEDGKVQGYKCPSCAAEMVASDTTAATECPYCGNQAIIPQSFEGIYKPDLMIPFSIDKKTAVDALQEFTKGKKLLPNAFTENNRIEKISGVYVPFWLYSCHAKGSVSFEGVKSKKWEDANYSYEKKDHFSIVRRGEMDFVRIPADASTQMDDATMDSLEPFDYSKAVEYDAAYFSGYLADRYDVEEEQARPRANERVKNTFRDKMREQVHNYNEVSHKSDSISLSNARAEYAMLPVWMMSTRYEDNIYTFGINGQTGKLVGSLPVDMGKYIRYLVIAALICMAVLSVIMMLIGAFSGGAAVAALVISIIAGFIYANMLKSAMNTIAVKSKAAEYMDDRSVVMGNPDDRFMFSKTEKKEKQKQG
ncbi:MAG: magnesium transporter [Lachnospiraceae bacterium]|nr:magnesium transporter [Lachnospiraceae bacterium]